MKLRTLKGYQAHAQYLSQCSEDLVGWTPVNPSIPSPYMFSMTRAVFDGPDGLFVIYEVAHRKFEVHSVARRDVYKKEEAAFARAR